MLTAITIPLSLLFAFTCMHFTGIPANLLSLGALDFGIIVDGTLVMVEHIVQSLNRSGKGARRRGRRFRNHHAARALDVESPIFFSLLIIISAYIPLFTLERVERRLFTPMAYTVCFALLGSMLLALDADSGAGDLPVPPRLPDPGRTRCCAGSTTGTRCAAAGHRAARRLDGGRRPRRWWPGRSLLAAHPRHEFLPQLDEGTIWVRANFPAGDIARKIGRGGHPASAACWRTSPKSRLVGSQSGRNDSGTDPFGPNRNELFVALKPYDQWPRGHAQAATGRADLAAACRREIPGANFNLTQPIIDNVTEAVTGSSADLAVIISGPDLGRLRAPGRPDAGRVCNGFRGAADTFLEQEADQAQLRILIDRQAVARYGINVRDVQDVIEMAIGGKPISTVFEGERRLRRDGALPGPGARRRRRHRRASWFPRATAGACRSRTWRASRWWSGASIIARRENIRQISVRTNIRGRDQGSFVERCAAPLRRRGEAAAGLLGERGAASSKTWSARASGSPSSCPSPSRIIFALLFFAFGSAGSAGLVLVNVPFSLVGGVVFLYLRGINLSVSAAVGFISLFGVAVMSGRAVHLRNQPPPRRAGDVRSKTR